MDAFDAPQIEEAHHQNGELYHEFLRANRLSVGLYVLEAGASAFVIRGFDPLQDTIDWGKQLIPMVRDGAAARSK